MTTPRLLSRLPDTYSYLCDYQEHHIWKRQAGDTLPAYIDQINLSEQFIIIMLST